MNRILIGATPRGMTGPSLITEKEPDARNAFDMEVSFQEFWNGIPIEDSFGTITAAETQKVKVPRKSLFSRSVETVATDDKHIGIFKTDLSSSDSSG